MCFAFPAAPRSARVAESVHQWRPRAGFARGGRPGVKGEWTCAGPSHQWCSALPAVLVIALLWQYIPFDYTDKTLFSHKNILSLNLFFFGYCWLVMTERKRKKKETSDFQIKIRGDLFTSNSTQWSIDWLLYFSAKFKESFYISPVCSNFYSLCKSNID